MDAVLRDLRPRRGGGGELAAGAARDARGPDDRHAGEVSQ